jgi:TPR repeat protein
MFSQGRGVAQSGVKAARLYHEAADQGDVQVQCSLWIMFSQGCVVMQSYLKAAR